MIKALAAVLVLVLFGAFAPEAAAQTSCAGWNATCKGRCKAPNAPDGCSSYCARQMSACKKSGCWTEGARYGGAKHCNLKKS